MWSFFSLSLEIRKAWRICSRDFTRAAIERLQFTIFTFRFFVLGALQMESSILFKGKFMTY